MIDDWQNGGFGLYIHWPFCEAKCPYCDFNSHVVRHIDQTAWAAAYLAELDRVAAETPDRVLKSVFFGGGTPSLMDPRIVAQIIDRITERWTCANDIEITLEANPSSVEAERFAAFSDAGINRVSIGVQALNDADLRRLGRIHSASEALSAIDIARSRFARVSFDLIYARQNQTLAEWSAELRQALSMGPDHLSLYQLTIEAGTAFGDRYDAGRLRGLPTEDLAADMYEATQALCATAGLPAYEVSNHARADAQSRHNLIYWRYGDYLGIGPGAHGRVTLDGQKYATETALAPGRWLQDVSQGGGEAQRTAITPKDQAGEYLMMGLRITEGIDLRRYANLAGQPLPHGPIEHLQEIGLVQKNDHSLWLTPNGRMVLNAVVVALLPD